MQNRTETYTSSLQSVADKFAIPTGVRSILPFGNGHINDSYIIFRDREEAPAYFLQRINHFVFKDVPGLINNIKQVTSHLRSKIRLTENAKPDERVLRLVRTKSGKHFYQDEEGEYWRMYHYLKNTKSYDQVSTPTQANEAGKAFGRFHAMLADLDASQLICSIPDFLNMKKRLDAFETALLKADAGRLNEVSSQTSFIREKAEAMCYFQQPAIQQSLPLRIIHHDTKINNILFDANDQVQCIVDLDTVMPGYVAYDFGDAIRSIITTAAEDEADLSLVQLKPDLFKAYAEGYLDEAGMFLTRNEVESLIHGVLLLPYMQAVRFLTDFLLGDPYYKIHFASQNLQRCNTQLELFRKLEMNAGKLSEIIHSIQLNYNHESQKLSKR